MSIKEAEVKNEVQNDEAVRIELDPIPFDGMVKSKLMTTKDLGVLINSLFKSIFFDYEGSTVIVENGGINVALYFRDRGTDDGQRYRGVIPTVAPKSANQTSIKERIIRLNASAKGNSYMLSQEAKDILTEFVFSRHGINKNAQIDWNQYVSEVIEGGGMFGGVQTINVKVSNIDVMKVLRKLYGNKSDDSFVDYNISIIKPVINGMNQGIYQNFLISVQQLQNSDVERLAEQLGMMPSGGNIPIIR